MKGTGYVVNQLLLIRHGRTAYNAEHRFQGQVDIPLDERGSEQARAVADHLASAGITKIVSSDLTRAVATAQAVAEASGLELTTDPGLREISVGEWEGYTRTEIEARWPEECAAWSAGTEVRPPGGESRTESSQRVAGAIERIIRESAQQDVLAIVAHGAVIRGASSILLGLDDSSAGQLSSLDNCEYAHFLWRRGRWVLRRWAGSAQPLYVQ